MISAKRSAIFPLSITDPVPFADCNPPIFTDGFARLGISLFKPGDDQRCLWFELAMSHIVVREGAVKGILPRHEGDRNIVAAGGRIGIIKTAIIGCPVS